MKHSPQYKRAWWIDASQSPHIQTTLHALITTALTISLWPSFSFAGQVQFDDVPVDITTSAGEDLVIAPGGTGLVQIGDKKQGIIRDLVDDNDDLIIVGDLEVEGKYRLEGISTFNNTATFNRSVVIGSAIADQLTIVGRLASHMVPMSDGSYDLGSNLLAWRTVYTDGVESVDGQDLYLAPASGSGLIGSVLRDADTGDEVLYALGGTVDKETSGNYTALQVNVTETDAPGSDNKLLDLRVDGVSQFEVGPTGYLTIKGSMLEPPLSLAGEGRIYFDSVFDEFRVSEDGGAYASLGGGGGGSGDITAVGSVTTGDAFNGAGADDEWLGLGAAAGRIEFDDQATDEVNILNANVGIGTQVPEALLHVSGGDILLDSNESLFWKDTGGTARGILTLDFGNNVHIAAAPNGPGEGAVYITGNNDTRLRTTTANNLYLQTNSGNIIMGQTGEVDEYMRINNSGNIGIDTDTPGARLEVEVDDTDNVAGILIDQNEDTNDNHGLVIDVVDGGGAPIRIVPVSTSPNTTDEGSIYYDSDDDNLYVYANGGWVDLTSAGGSGDITAVGSMTSGDAFADATADDDWLGLGAAAGRIEFDDQATDEVNILNANVGIGTSTPGQELEVNGDIRLTNQGNFIKSVGSLSVEVDLLGVTGNWAEVVPTQPNLNGISLWGGEIRINNAGDNRTAIGGDATPDAVLEVIKSGTLPTFLVSATADGDGDILTINNAGNVGIDTPTPGARLEVEVDDTENAIGLLVDQDDVTNNPHALVVDVADGGGAPIRIVPISTAPTTTDEGSIYYDSDDDNLYVYADGGWVDLTQAGGSGDITAVGSMGSGDVFMDASADDDWLGLGAAAGRIEFDDQATDEVNILNANVGIGTQTPTAKIEVEVATASDQGLILQTTDNSATNNLMEFQNAAGAVTTAFLAGGNLAFGSAPAQSGQIRFSNNYSIIARNSTDSADAIVLRLGNDNLAYYGNSAIVTNISGGTNTVFVSGNNGRVGIGNGTNQPTAKLDVTVADTSNIPGVVIDNDDVTNNTPGLQISMAETGGAPLLIDPLSTAPTTTAEGSIYYDSDDDNLYVYANGGWVDLTQSGGSGDITAVGSMGSGDVFMDATADDDWLGLGAAAGRIEFDDQAVDEVLIKDARLGIGTETPVGQLHISGDNLQQIILEDERTGFERQWAVRANDSNFYITDVTAANAVRMRVNSSGDVAFGAPSATNARLHVSNTNDQLVIEDSDAAADEKKVLVKSNSGVFELVHANDAFNSFQAAMQINRTGVAVDNVLFPNGLVGVGAPAPGARFEVEVDDTENAIGLLVDQDDVTNNPHALVVDVADGGGAPIRIVPISTAPTTTDEGSIYYDSDDDNLYVYANGGWVDLTQAGGSGDITRVGSMVSGDAFADATADDDWLGLGAAAGRIEFDDQATDEVNILNANVGIGGSAPSDLLSIYQQADSNAIQIYGFDDVSSNYLEINIDSNGYANVWADQQISVRSGQGGSYGGDIGKSGAGGLAWDAFNQFTLSAASRFYIPLAIQGYASQVASLFVITSNGGSSGDLVTVDNDGNVGIGQPSPSAKLEVEVADAANVAGILIDQNEVTNNNPGLQIDMAETGGAPLLISPLSAAPTTTAEGSIYYDSDDDNLYVYANGGWVDLTQAGGSGDITRVGSMVSGDAFADATADDDWLGLGAAAGRIEFDDQAIDEINIISARLGLDEASPNAKLHITAATDQLLVADTDGPVDENKMLIKNNGGLFEFVTANDAYNSFQAAMQINRTGVAVDNVLFPNGLVGIGAPSPGARFEVEVDDTENAIGLLVDQDDVTNNPHALVVDVADGGGAPVRIVPISTSPTTTDEGSIYYDSDDDNLYVYANGGWVDLTQQGSGVDDSLQTAYDTGAVIAATDAKDIAITLTNTATDPNFTISTPTGGAGFTSINRADGAGTADPAQLLLIDNLDSDRAQPIGIKVQSAAGNMTTGIDLTDGQLTTAVSLAGNTITGTTMTLDGDGILSLGNNPAATGAIRLGNSNAIHARRADNAADISMLVLDASDYARIGGGSIYTTTFGGAATMFVTSNDGGVGIGNGTNSPSAKLEVTADSASNVTAVLINHDDITNDNPGLQIDMAETGGAPLIISPLSAAPNTTAEGAIYYDSDDDNLFVYANGGWVDLTQQAATGLWTDQTTFLEPSSDGRSIRTWDAGGTDYMDIAHDGTDANISTLNAATLNIEPNAAANVTLFESAGVGENPYLHVYGDDSGVPKRGDIRVDSSGTFTIASEAGESLYLEGQTLLQLNPQASGPAYFFEQSASGENQPVRIYGYDTGASSTKYGSLNVDVNGAFSLFASAGEALVLEGPNGALINYTGDSDVQLFGGATTGENPFLRVYGYDSQDGAAIKYGNINIDDWGTFTLQSQSGENLHIESDALLRFNWNANAPVYLFEGATSGENPALRIYSYPAGAAGVNYASLQVVNANHDLQLTTANSAGDILLTPGANVGIGAASPAAKLEVEVANSANVPGILIDQDDTANDEHGLVIDVVDGGGAPVRLVPVSTAPNTTDEGAIYYDSDDDNLYVYANGGWVDLTQTGGGSGDITRVGSMVSGDAFADATADDDWLGLGAAAGRIEFDDQATDEVNILNARVGIGTQTPATTLDVRGSGIYWGSAAAIYGRMTWTGTGNTSANIYSIGHELHLGSSLPDDIIIDTDGNVGFNNTNPDSLVDIAKTTATGSSEDVFHVAVTTGVMDGSDTIRAAYVDVTNADHTGASNTLYGLDIDGITGDAEATEIGLHVGTGWDMAAHLDGDVGIGTGSPGTRLEVFTFDSAPNAITDVLTVTHDASTPAAGIGTGIDINIGDAGGIETQGKISVELDVVTNDLEEASMVFQVNQTGTLTELLRLDGTDGNVGIRASTPQGLLEIEAINNGTNVPTLLIDNNDITNDTPGIQIDMAETGGAPLLISPLSAAPNTTAEGSIYYDSDDDNLYVYADGGWVDLTQTGGGSGDITRVGSMVSGDAFADATADDDWLGLGAAAGRIEFDDQATDEINFLNAFVGIGTSTPDEPLDIVAASANATIQLNSSGGGGEEYSITSGTDGVFRIQYDFNLNPTFIINGPTAAAGIGPTSLFNPSARFEVEVADAENYSAILIDQNDATNNNHGLVVDVVDGGGAPVRLVPISTAPATTDEGSIYYDSDDDNLYVYANGGWVDLTQSGGSGDITRVGSMVSGDAFSDSTADDDWLGLGAAAGRIEFDDQATDEILLLNADVGIGNMSDPNNRLDVYQNYTVGTNTLADFNADMSGTSGSYSNVVSLYAGAYTGVTGAGGSESYGIIAEGSTANDGVSQGAIGAGLSVAIHAGDVGYGAYISDVDTSTAGTVYGVYINLDDADLTRYGIYQLTANDNYFAGDVGIGQNNPAAKLEVEVADAANVTGILIDQNEVTNNNHGLVVDVVNGGGAPVRLVPISTAPATTDEGSIYYDSDDDNLYVYANGGWVDLTQQSSAGLWTDLTGAIKPNTDGDDVRVYDAGGTDYLELSHDGTDANISLTNTVALNVSDGTNDLLSMQDANEYAAITSTIGSSGGALDVLSITTNASSGNMSADLIQLTLDGVNADGFSGHGLHVIVDKSQFNGAVGAPIYIEDDASNLMFSMSEDGSLFLGDEFSNVGRLGPATGDILAITHWSGVVFSSAGDGNYSFRTDAIPAAGASGNLVSIPSSLSAMNGSDTVRGLMVDLTNGNHTGSGNTLYGIDIDAITGDAQATEIGLHIGDGWDYAAQLGGDLRFEAGGITRTISPLNGAGTPSALVIAGGDGSAPDGGSGALYLTGGSNTAGNGAEVYVYGGNSGGYPVGDVILAHTGSVARGNVGIGDNNPSELLDVDGTMEFDIKTTGDTTIGLCKDVADGTGTDVEFRECNGTPSDIAEFYRAQSDLLPGDIVSLSTVKGIPTLVRSQKLYDPQVVGVVSTFPVGQHGKPLGHSAIEEEGNPTAIGLVGRVPVKVSTINGDIKVGDPLAVGPIPGTAMKATRAGRIIGYALEDYDGSVLVSSGVRQQEQQRAAAIDKFNADPVDPSDPSVGKILVFTNLSHYQPSADVAIGRDIPVKPIEGALDTIDQLRGVEVDDSSHTMGLVPDEVESVMPNWVESDPDGAKYLQLRGFEALVIEALKELKAENSALKRRLDQFEQAQ